LVQLMLCQSTASREVAPAAAASVLVAGVVNATVICSTS
jgi:hypothetical protein